MIEMALKDACWTVFGPKPTPSGKDERYSLPSNVGTVRSPIFTLVVSPGKAPYMDGDMNTAVAALSRALLLGMDGFFSGGSYVTMGVPLPDPDLIILIVGEY